MWASSSGGGMTPEASRCWGRGGCPSWGACSEQPLLPRVLGSVAAEVGSANEKSRRKGVFARRKAGAEPGKLVLTSLPPPLL